MLQLSCLDKQPNQLVPALHPQRRRTQAVAGYPTTAVSLLALSSVGHRLASAAEPVLSLDPRDPEITSAKQLQRRPG